MCDDGHSPEDGRNPSKWRVALNRWLVRVLGVKTGLTIVIPPGATLFMPQGSTVETINVAGGTLNYGDGRMGVEPLPKIDLTTCDPRGSAAGWKSSS